MTNETAIETRSLRERIAEVKATNDRETAENEAKVAQRRREDLIDMLKERLGVTVDERAIKMRDHETPVVEVEGFQFSIAPEGDLSLLKTCEACGKEYDKIIWSLAGMVESFVPYPHTNNYCLEREQQPASLTTEERLLQVLRELIAENSYRPE